MLNLCFDVILEITSHCDSRACTALLLINKQFYQWSAMHPTIRERRQLIEELSKTQALYKNYYRHPIMELKLNDRVTDTIYNYRVHSIEKKKGILEIVDMLGNGFNVFIYMALYRMNNKIKSTGWYWAARHDHDDCILIKKLKFGIIKHEYGPPITHVDSHYLSCITKPKCSSILCNLMGHPEWNMLVVVGYKWSLYEYVIIDLQKNSITMKLVHPMDDYINKTLQIQSIHNRWVCKNKKYKVLYFGGWCGHF